MCKNLQLNPFPLLPFRVSFDPEDLPSTPRLWRGTKCRIEGNPFRMNPSPQGGEGDTGGKVKTTIVLHKLIVCGVTPNG